MAWYDKLIVAGLLLWIIGGVTILVGFYGLQKSRPKFNEKINIPITQNNSAR